MSSQVIKQKPCFSIKHLKLLIWILFCLVCSMSCQTKYKFMEEPPAIIDCPPKCHVRVALVLGGGGARGLAHIGVLEEFEEQKIPIDIIVGCSAGAIVGALYADNPNANYIKRILQPLRKWDILDINIFNARYGLVQGRSLKAFLNKNLKSRNFDQLQIPLYVVATDIYAGELICIGSGSIIPAVHASAAVPFVFSPVLLNGRVLVDGGVADPIPVAVAKKYEAEIVIAVDLSELLPKTWPNNLFGIASRSAEIKFLLQSESCAKDADIVIRPDLKEVGLFDDNCNKKIYEAGRKAAQAAIPEILEMIQKKGLNCSVDK